MSTCSEENMLFLFPFISPPKYRLDNNSRLIHADPIFFRLEASHCLYFVNISFLKRIGFCVDIHHYFCLSE